MDLNRFFVFVFSMILLLSSCSSPSLEDYRDEGRGMTKKITKELQKIRTRDQLAAAAPKLQKLFDQMADLMIAAQEHKQKNSKEELTEMAKIDHDLSDSLRFELDRIYYIDGGRAIIEKAQERALSRIEAYEKFNAKTHKARH